MKPLKGAVGKTDLEMSRLTIKCHSFSLSAYKKHLIKNAPGEFFRSASMREGGVFLAPLPHVFIA